MPGGRGRRWLVTLALGLGLVAMPPGSEAGPANRVPERSGEVVVDAQGRVIGVQVGVDEDASVVWVRRAGIDTLVEVVRGRIRDGTARLGFESSDCSTTPWLRTLIDPGVDPLLSESALGQDGLLYVGRGTLTTKQIQATWNTSLDPPQCDPQAPFFENVLPAEPFLDTTEFQPPFRHR